MPILLNITHSGWSKAFTWYSSVILSFGVIVVKLVRVCCQILRVPFIFFVILSSSDFLLVHFFLYISVMFWFCHLCPFLLRGNWYVLFLAFILFFSSFVLIHTFFSARVLGLLNDNNICKLYILTSLIFFSSSAIHLFISQFLLYFWTQKNRNVEPLQYQMIMCYFGNTNFPVS